MNKEKFYRSRLVSIDAWHGEEGWYWNNSWLVEKDIMWGDKSLTTRIILRYLRKWGFLSEESKGKVRVQDDWPIIEIQERNNHRPLFALIFDED